jgi:deazaflavin-dependent oxidoreductase (nitroreductase family)
MPTVPSDEEFRTYNQGVISEFRANHGTVSQPPFPILLLTTNGARTGRQTTVPLGFGVDDKGRVFVVGSKAGAPNHPAWFHNLRANPTVTVELGDSSWSRAIASCPFRVPWRVHAQTHAMALTVPRQQGDYRHHTMGHNWPGRSGYLRADARGCHSLTLAIRSSPLSSRRCSTAVPQATLMHADHVSRGPEQPGNVHQSRSRRCGRRGFGAGRRSTRPVPSTYGGGTPASSASFAR